jgi:hypothetical protein
MDTILLKDVIEAMLQDSAWEITKQLRKKTRYMKCMQAIFECRIGRSTELDVAWIFKPI